MLITPSPWHDSHLPPLTLKLKRPGVIPANLAFREHGEQGADVVEGLGVRRGVGARRAADGRLVDVDHLVKKRQALDLPEGKRLELSRCRVFAQARDTGSG